MSEIGQHGILLAGFAAGTFLTGLSLSALKVSPLTIFVPPGDIPTLVAGFGGALLGAAIGAAVQHMTAAQQRQDAAKDRANAELQRELAGGFSCFIKATQLANELTSIQATITESIALVDEKGGKDLPLWVKLKPIIGLPSEPIQFSTSDIALLFKLNLVDCANNAQLISMRYRVFIDALQKYNTIRESIVSDLTPNGDGDFDISKMKPEDRRRLTPIFYDLKTLSESNTNLIVPLLTDAKELVHALWPAFRARFGEKAFPKAL